MHIVYDNYNSRMPDIYNRDFISHNCNFLGFIPIATLYLTM